MKLNLYIYLSLIILLSPMIMAQPNDIIIEDTWDPFLDKVSHATASFGFYYTFRYYENSKFESALYTALMGISFEIYQINDPNEEDSDFRGISIQDLGYNFIGIATALGLDIIINNFKKNLQKNQSNNPKYYYKYKLSS